MRPCVLVNHVMMKLVSPKRVRRSKIASVVSMRIKRIDASVSHRKISRAQVLFDGWLRRSALLQRPMNEPTPSPATANQNPPATPALDQAKLNSTYSNICRIAQTPDEVVIDFGTNLNFYGQIVDELPRLDQRIIMTHQTAKRLSLYLANTIAAYEQKYGVVELDVAKRVKQ
jgi:hypothetical protein